MKFCVIGNPISQSQSPFIHQEFAKEAGLNISYEKLLASKEAGGFLHCINELKAKGFKGCNVTLPFKEQAYAIADVCSNRAKRAKAANTLTFNQNGSVFADNTDGVGLIRDIEGNLNYALKNKRILICGAGGAVRGILYPIIEQQPKSLAIANRTYEKAIKLSEEFSDVMTIEPLHYQDLVNKEFDVIIDGTSFAEEALPLPAVMQFSENSLFYDLKYPIFKKQGAKIQADGAGMLVEQAAESFYIWTGFRPETHHVISKLKKLLYEK